VVSYLNTAKIPGPALLLPGRRFDVNMLKGMTAPKIRVSLDFLIVRKYRSHTLAAGVLAEFSPGLGKNP
jgi:hypothetical protein